MIDPALLTEIVRRRELARAALARAMRAMGVRQMPTIPGWEKDEMMGIGGQVPTAKPAEWFDHVRALRQHYRELHERPFLTGVTLGLVTALVGFLLLLFMTRQI